jgi:starch synthase
MRILFVSSEGLPFSKTGGLADVVEALPKALVEVGHEVLVVLPRYRGTKSDKVVAPSLTIPLGARLRFPRVTDGQELHGVRYFFVDEPCFDRDKLYGDASGDYPDNAERFALFSKAAIEIAKQVWKPDVLHCHDWQSALVPVLLRTVYGDDPAVKSLPVVFTVHNMGYHGLFGVDVLGRVGLPGELFHMDALEFYGRVNYLKGGLLYSDYITTVSRKYALEVQTPEYGHGLEGVVRRRGERMVGILNGVDYSVWSPECDTYLAAKYSAKNLSGKVACKKDLLKEYGLPADNVGRPLIGIVSRFADQKGFDLIAQVAHEMLKEDLAIVALGTGDAKYENLFREMAKAFPGRLAARIGFDNALAHKIEAGSDMFLMPSRYEPCGLNQIYSLRYGTVPVVRATGGLDDTIQHFDPSTAHGTGFKFEAYDGRALLDCVRQAVRVYNDKEAWRRLMANGMAKDFSWTASAGEYARLYEAARKARI